MKRISRIDNIIFMLSLALVVYHTCTFLQRFYSFYVTVGVFAVIVVLDIISCHGRLPRNRINGAGYYLIVMAALTLIAYTRKLNLILIAGTYLPILIWTFLFFIVDGCTDFRDKKRFIGLYTIPWAVSMLATLKVVLTNNDAARQLAGAATDAERAAYYSQGVGGYGFVYGCVFLLFCMLFWRSLVKNRLGSVLLLLLICAGYAMVLFASYTFAVLLSLGMLIMFVYMKSKNKYATWGLVIAVVIVFQLKEVIFELFANIGRSLDLYWIENRFTQLINSDQSNNYESLRRYQLYRRSIISFLVSPFVGREKIGGHSTILDLMGRFGVLGICMVGGVFRMFWKLQRRFPMKYGMLFLMMIVLIAFDTLESIVMTPMLMFMCPLVISNVCDAENKTKGRKPIK